jgi:hypothetical protein
MCCPRMNPSMPLVSITLGNEADLLIGGNSPKLLSVYLAATVQ